MTFSVSKLEPQLNFWFALVLCYVLAYCTNRTEEDSLYHHYVAKDSALQDPIGTDCAKPELGRRSLEKEEYGAQSCSLSWAGEG